MNKYIVDYNPNLLKLCSMFGVQKQMELKLYNQCYNDYTDKNKD